MRASRVSLALLLLLALAACAGPDTAVTAPTSSPAATAPSSSPAVASRPGRLVSSANPYTADGPATPTDYGAPGTAQAKIMYALQEQVLGQAGAPAHTSVTCDKQFITGRVEANCTVMFDDLAVPMDVTASIANLYVTWSAVASVGVLSRADVDWLWYGEAVNNNARPGTARCDAAMPVQAVLPFGTTPFFCWYTTAAGAVVEKQVSVGRQRITFEKA